MRKLEKLYSVTLTEYELRAFSDYLYQREFGEPLSDRLKRGAERVREGVENYTPQKIQDNMEEVGRIAQRAADGSKRLIDAATFVEKNHGRGKSGIDLLGKHQRMSKRWIVDKNPELVRETELAKNNPGKLPGLFKETGNIIGMIAEEDRLKETGYDDRYSARGLEKVLGKRISGDEAKNIVDRRSALSDKYQGEYDEVTSSRPDGIKGYGQDLGRRWDDAKMVYEEALDGRSLGKDAALAAGGAAVLGIAAHAIKKAKKRRAAEKEILDTKYKTSDKKKKK